MDTCIKYCIYEQYSGRSRKARGVVLECRETRQVRRSALKEPAFRRYFPASWFSSLGSWMLRFLLGWAAWDLTESATWVGVVAALMLAPAFVLSPLFGILSDRVNPRHGLIASMMIHGLIALAGWLSMWLAVFDLGVLLALAFAMGAVTSGHSPMRLALIPLLVSRDALPSAVGLSAMTFNTARILGPALGAWVIRQAGPGEAFAISVFMFATSGAVLASLHGVGQRLPKPREPFIDQLNAGLRYARQHRGIRLVFAFTIVNGLLGRTLIELLPALSGALLQGGSSELATLTASAGAGSIVGGLVVSRQAANSSRLLSMVAAAIGAAALMLLTLYWMVNLALLSALIALLAMCTTMAGTGCQTLTQLSLAEEYRGRVISLWTLLAMGAPALGSALVGALSDVFGFVPVLAVAAGLGVAVVLWLYARRAALLGG